MPTAPVRLAIKPVMDLLRNRAKLESPDPDSRRSAATDLGTSGRTVAIPWLDRRRRRSQTRGCGTRCRSPPHCLQLQGMTRPPRSPPCALWGDLASQNAVPALKEIVACWGATAAATEAQQALATGGQRVNRAHRDLGCLVDRHRNDFSWRQPQLHPLDHVAGARHRLRPHGCHQHGPWRVDDGRRLCDLHRCRSSSKPTSRPRCSIIISRPRCRWHSLLQPLADGTGS